jgi:GT2 family glycosyltransferase/Flp pilus assembly protein TadD
MRFSICVIEPEGYRFAHFLYDICKYLCYGIEAAGYDCCILRNKLSPGRVNIIVGAHNQTDPAIIKQIKQAGDYILVQSEIITGDSINNWSVQESFADVYLPLMRQAKAVWTGVETNIGALKKLDVEADLILMGYHPLMEEVHHKLNKDIDFLFCGSITPHRKKLIDDLGARGGKVVTIFDDAAMYRNDLIARTRVNLAPNQGPGMNHFGGSRVLYLVNNRSIVVVESCHDQQMYEHCFPFANTERWVDLCLDTLRSPDLERLTEEYYERFKKIRMVDLIEPLLEKFASSWKSSAEGKTPTQGLVTKPAVSAILREDTLKPHFRQENCIPGLISIVIVTFNELENTKRCVKSIREHTPEAHEIIFVDNCSTDVTVKWLKRLVQEHDNYQYIENKNNLGYTKGCNLGIERCQGETILLLHNDVVVSDGWLTGMLECLISAPDIGIVGPMTSNISGPQRVVNVSYGSMTQMEEFASGFRVRNRHRQIPAHIIAGYCVLFKRELAAQIGFLNEGLGSGDLENDDYCLRASLEGYRNVIAGDVYIHRGESGGHSGYEMDSGLATIRSKRILGEKWGSIDVSSITAKKLLALIAIEKATEFAHRQRLQEAVETLTNAIKYSPEEKGIYYRLAEILIDAKLFKEAFMALQALAEGSKGEQTYFELIGYCHEGLNADDEAESCADRVLSLHGTPAVALNLKGVLAYKKGDRSSAEEFFKKSISADPSYGEPYSSLGVLAWSAGQKDEALGFLERGFILSPTSADVINLYHNALTDSGQFERAEPFFLEAKSIYPNNQRIAFLLIDLLIQRQKYPEALHEIQKAMLTFGIDDGTLTAALAVSGKIKTNELRKKPKGKATLSLAMIVKNEEEHIAKCLWSAKPIADEIVVVDTGSTDRTKDIAMVFDARVYNFKWINDFSEARNYSLSLSSCDWILILDADEVISPIDYAKLSKIINKNLSKPTAYRLTTRNYTDRLNVDQWNANDGKYPLEEAGNGWYPSGKVRLFKRDQRIRFVNPIHECVEPTIIAAGIQITSCPIPIHHYGPLSSHEKIQEKRKAYYLLSKRKVEEKGDDQHAIYELALVTAELGQYDEAITLWERFFQLDATMPPEFIHSAHINMGFAYTQLGRYQEALDVSRKLLGLNPGLKEAVVNHANCMIWLDSAERVIRPLEDLVKQIPDYIPALSLLAVAYLLCSQAVKGQDCLKGLRKRGFDTASYLLEQAKILWFLERVEHARTLLEAALQIRDDEEGRRLLEECSKSIEGGGTK